MASQTPAASEDLCPVDIKPLLAKMWPNDNRVTADEIAEAVSHFFTNQVTPAQTASLLMALHFTQMDFQPEVLAKCAAAMLKAAAPIPVDDINAVILKRGRKEGKYNGGLCDIVGTGGDSHNTFNISTTASIIASALILVSKHGNKASTSKSGSADLIANMQPRPPVVAAVTPANLAKIYAATNYSFLFAPLFHTGMRYVAPIRKQLPWRTIFNNVGPLANPVEAVLECRVIGVGRKDLGPAFAEALRSVGCRKAMIVCGDEDLDELSCAGSSHCWMLKEKTPGGETYTDYFTVEPSDFGVSTHGLNEVSSGKEPKENAAILQRILHGELQDDDPLVEFVLINVAALFVVSGICEAELSNMGTGDDGKVITERGPGGQRWKEGVRRAKWAIRSGEAWKQWSAFVDITNELGA
ncbi:anthranilate phosphoribosyltransferase [Cordyceps militaris]|uniref:Anthranilate phosphoribosyltransferase n=1 Tax=Cordyceps militaris TaxID=73501 RepID=A0A2H4SU49_CORMI|nr:anthranilate phosphoribosyltransferase [Cordyceps militaris]